MLLFERMAVSYEVCVNVFIIAKKIKNEAKYNLLFLHWQLGVGCRGFLEKKQIVNKIKLS